MAHSFSVLTNAAGNLISLGEVTLRLCSKIKV